MTARIVVGVDGSAGAQDALEQAVPLADALDAELDVVSAWQVFYGTIELPSAPTISAEHLRDEARATLREALDAVDTGALVVHEHALEGDAATVLLEVAEGADMLVVGSRGRGGLTGLLLGSVSQKCVQHARCPVLVVPPGD